MKIAWALKQLLPFKYNTKCRTEDKKYQATWRMWLGKVYNPNFIQID